MTFFNPKSSADRYAKGRPYSHDISIGRIKKFLNINDKINRALDIACGTGLSTRALLEIANNVYGTDISEEMLNLALHKDKINYSIASAEKQPFPDKSFDLITVCAGVHWFDIDKFLVEANRLLKNDSWLILYATYGISAMTGEKEFKKWLDDICVARFPYPSSNYNYKWTNDNLKSKKFLLQKNERFETKALLSKQQLINFLTSQSNITQAVENGQSAYDEIDQWLNSELTPFFKHEQTKEICLENPIMYLQKVGD